MLPEHDGGNEEEMVECLECKGTGNSDEPQSPFWSDGPRKYCTHCDGQGEVLLELYEEDHYY